MSSNTMINEGSGGVWNLAAPDGVTVEAVTDPTTKLTTGLHLFIDYTYADFNNPQTGSIETIHITGPATDPNGPPPPINQSFPGLKLATTIDIRNDLGVPISGLGIYLANDGAATVPAIDTKDPHPDDYAHFHGLTTTSLIDKTTGTANATLTLYDPNFGPAVFGPPTAGGAAPSFISAAGTIAPGATEELRGGNADGTFTLHSEDTPGPNGGSFTLALYAQNTIGAPVAPSASTVRLFPTGVITVGAHQGDGKDYIFAGTSDAINDLPMLQFISNAANSPNTVTVGTGFPANGPVVFGKIMLASGSNVTLINGLNANHGSLAIDHTLGSVLTLNNTSTIDNDGSVVSAPQSNGAHLTINGTLTMGAIGNNVLNLDGEQVNGKGSVVIQGENDKATVRTVDGPVHFTVNGGSLILLDPTSFQGVIGPVNGTGAQSIGIFGSLSLSQTDDVSHATFDTSVGVLHLLTNSNQDRGDLQFAGNASGLSLTRQTLNGSSFIAVNDHPGGGGNIPLSFT